MCNFKYFVRPVFLAKSSPEEATYNVSPPPQPTTGTIDERLQAINKANLDGRWLLVAQHLECWKQLWAPQLAEFFPSIELLMTKLIHAETVLASYS